MLMSASENVEISQVVDPKKTARFSMPIEILFKIGADMDY